MKVVIGTKTYTEIANLSFSPETDVAGVKIPVNEFWVDIHTEDSIRNGATVILKDDLDNIWAKYWIIYAERIADGIYRICGQSKIALLDRRTLSPAMYENAALSQVLQEIFSQSLINEYAVDQVFTGKTISGYCPEQTARERLLWVCFVIGAYVRTFFSPTIDILPLAGDTIVIPGEGGDPDQEYEVENEVISVPIEKIFWRPTVTHTDVVTAVKIRKYAFTQGSPTATDEYVQIGSIYYIVTSQWMTLANPNAPATAPPNEKIIDGVTLVNDDNASLILSHLSKYYFNNLQIDLDVINNADYEPGEQLMVYTDEDTLMKGFVEQMSFRFGLQARSQIRLAGVGDSSDVESGKLIIKYVYGTLTLDQKKYTFPVGYVYSIENPYQDTTMNRHRYVYRPLNAAAEGTIAAGTNVNTQQYAIALDLDQLTKHLHIISVDSVEVQTVDGVSIAVIDGGISGSSSGGSGGSSGGTGGSGEGTESGGTGSGEGSGSGESTGGSGGSQSGESSSPAVIGSSGITSYPRQVYNSETGYVFTSDGLVVKHSTGTGESVDVTSSCTLDISDGDVIAIPNGVSEFTFPVNITYTYDGQNYSTSYTVTVYA